MKKLLSLFLAFVMALGILLPGICRRHSGQ